jgi:hypothetical protein
VQVLTPNNAICILLFEPPTLWGMLMPSPPNSLRYKTQSGHRENEKCVIEIFVKFQEDIQNVGVYGRIILK